MQEVTLITGGSNGIGAAIGASETALGRHVLNLDLAAPQAELPSQTYIKVDLANRVLTRELLKDIGGKYAVSRIVNNVGATGGFGIEKIPLDRLDLLNELHIVLPIMLMQMALPSMRERRFGRVVFISSGAAKGRPNASIYGATRASMMSLAASWALELGRDGVTVNAIAPGPVQTDLFLRGAPVGSTNYEYQKSRTAIGRLGVPKDVAVLAAFLLGADSENITGQTIFTCGGASIGQSPLPPY